MTPSIPNFGAVQTRLKLSDYLKYLLFLVLIEIFSCAPLIYLGTANLAESSVIKTQKGFILKSLYQIEVYHRQDFVILLPKGALNASLELEGGPWYGTKYKEKREVHSGDKVQCRTHGRYNAIINFEIPASIAGKVGGKKPVIRRFPQRVLQGRTMGSLVYYAWALFMAICFFVVRGKHLLEEHSVAILAIRLLKFLRKANRKIRDDNLDINKLRNFKIPIWKGFIKHTPTDNKIDTMLREKQANSPDCAAAYLVVASHIAKDMVQTGQKVSFFFPYYPLEWASANFIRLRRTWISKVFRDFQQQTQLLGNIDDFLNSVGQSCKPVRAVWILLITLIPFFVPHASLPFLLAIKLAVGVYLFASVVAGGALPFARCKT